MKIKKAPTDRKTERLISKSFKCLCELSAHLREIGQMQKYYAVNKVLHQLRDV